MTSEDITDDQIASWLGMLERPPYCYNPRTVHLKHTGIAGQGVAARIGCGSWSCPGCSSHKRLEYGVNIARHFFESDQFIACEWCPDDAWHAFRLRLIRAKAEYARIDGTGGSWVFYTSPRACSAPVFRTTADAVIRLGVRLRQMPARSLGDTSHPVSTSHGWRLARSSGDYKLVGLLPVARAERMRDTLSAAGVTFKERPSGDVSEWSIGYKLCAGQELVAEEGVLKVSDNKSRID